METVANLFLPVIVIAALLMVTYFVFETLMVVLGFIYDAVRGL